MQRYYSRIYWHFTGSPKGHTPGVVSPHQLLEKAKPKTENEAVTILQAILDSQVLEASSVERIGKYETNAFCSTTDIPFKDLVNHAAYYGKTAIGFKAEAIHDTFLPITYLSIDHFDQERLLQDEHPLLDFIKPTDFHPHDGHTFYREREWRKVGDFHFDKKDIAALVVPEGWVSQTQQFLNAKQFPEDISVLSWRLVEEA